MVEASSIYRSSGGEEIDVAAVRPVECQPIHPEERMLPKLNTRERDPDAAGRASGQTIESTLSAITVEVYELQTRNKVRRNERDILSVLIPHTPFSKTL